MGSGHVWDTWCTTGGGVRDWSKSLKNLSMAQVGQLSDHKEAQGPAGSSFSKCLSCTLDSE